VLRAGDPCPFPDKEHFEPASPARIASSSTSEEDKAGILDRAILGREDELLPEPFSEH